MPTAEQFYTEDKIGTVVDVRATSMVPCQPMMRTITDVKVSKDWVYWYWRPEAYTPEGRVDCGYSGRQVEMSS